MLEGYAFYFLASVMILASLLVVLLKNPIYNLFSLLICFLSLSGFFVLLNAEMLALFILLIYSAGLAIIFVFILMTVDLRNLNYKTACRSSVLGFLIILAEIIIISLVKFKSGDSIYIQNVKAYSTDVINLKLSLSLFKNYAYITIVMGLILLTGMIGSISLLAKNKKEIKNKKLSEKEEKPIELKNVESNQGVDIC